MIIVSIYQFIILNTNYDKEKAGVFPSLQLRGEIAFSLGPKVEQDGLYLESNKGLDSRMLEITRSRRR